ncbi:MAG: HAMP domain-containing histidine kinase [Bacteroidota bacterium]|nr:HAMP domain-containing histidine kinase [Bacteroidota bacterium]
MTFKKYEFSILLRVLLLFAALCGESYFVLNKQYVYALILLPVVVIQVINFYLYHKRAQREVEEFIEAIHYRDFSRHFNVKLAPAGLQPLRNGFNEINSAFKQISREKETQYQYLQKLLELVNTGILSYDVEGGKVIWMNEALKSLLGIPYLRTIESLNRKESALYAQIINLKPGETLITEAHPDKLALKILLSATAFETEGHTYKLIAFQNINEALDETENNAWQKLLRVLTHEIMNSVAPISSLAVTLNDRLRLALPQLTNNDGSIDDLQTGIDTIRRRSENLLKFVDTYRNLNRIQTLTLTTAYVRDVFENLYQLMEPTLDAKHIELDVILKDTSLQLEADINLVEQVLINLLINAIDAVKEKRVPVIALTGILNSNNRVVIKISDNGKGMDKEVMDKIFIPFFTTKKTGSGIGLSFCKQIMQLHKGSVAVQSTVGEGTTFTLQF